MAKIFMEGLIAGMLMSMIFMVSLVWLLLDLPEEDESMKLFPGDYFFKERRDQPSDTSISSAQS